MIEKELLHKMRCDECNKTMHYTSDNNTSIVLEISESSIITQAYKLMWNPHLCPGCQIKRFVLTTMLDGEERWEAYQKELNT